MKNSQSGISCFGTLLLILALAGVVEGIWYLVDSSPVSSTSKRTSLTQTSGTNVDEDALADKNCKNDLGFSNIFACRRALTSVGLDADQYVREKWITTGRKIKGVGFCEGFKRRSRYSDQFKVHYDKECNAKELWIWDNKLNDFKKLK